MRLESSISTLVLPLTAFHIGKVYLLHILLGIGEVLTLLNQ